MPYIFISISLVLFLGSCGASPIDKKAGKTKDTPTITNVTTYEYSIFHDKLLLTAIQKPYEEDATNQVSKLALIAYSDIKKYSFINMINKGAMDVTVSEFKEAVDSSFNTKKVLDELTFNLINHPSLKMKFSTPTSLNGAFNGYSVVGRGTVPGTENSFIYLAVLSDRKMLITTTAGLENVNDTVTVSKIVHSIKRK